MVERVLGVACVIVLMAGTVAALVETSGEASLDSQSEPTTSISDQAPPTSFATTTTTSITTSAPEQDSLWPELPDDGVARAVVTPTGVVVAVQQANADGTYQAISPCGDQVTVTGRAFSGAHVVLDPGHGGSETGAIGPGGLQEKDVNMAVVADAIRELESLGAVVVVTRTSDYRMTLASRAAVANALRPLAFVSIHHNSEPDGPSEGPGSEVYHQIASADSKRLAGLLIEEYRSRLADFDVEWVGDTDAGAKVRVGSDGGDYYGVLSRTSEVNSVLSEAAFISNPAEEQLLADPAFHAVESAAITSAISRFVFSDDPGSGFVEPYPRDTPAGGGGGPGGCVDPPLG